MNKKTKTFLAVGDMKDPDSFRKFYRQRRLFTKSSLYFKSMDYHSLLKDEFPEVKTKDIIIHFFFPFYYWDRYIEPKDYEGVYGNREFYSKFNDFLKIVKKKISDFYSDKRIIYLNLPENLAKDRDKEMTKAIVSRSGVPVPQKFAAREVKGILRLLDKGHKLFIKVRFGSMGKGITYLEKGRWMTNFRFRKGKILSRRSDYGWTFIDMTGNDRFLRQILKEDIMVEEAVDSLLIKGKKFDIRLLVYRDRILYYYARSNDAEAITTNISQGAMREKTGFLDSIPKRQLELAKKSALKAVRAMGLNFAGVDIIACSDLKSVSFLELNAFPGFPVARMHNLSKSLINEIIRDYSPH